MIIHPRFFIWYPIFSSGRSYSLLLFFACYLKIMTFYPLSLFKTHKKYFIRLLCAKPLLFFSFFFQWRIWRRGKKGAEEKKIAGKKECLSYRFSFILGLSFFWDYCRRLSLVFFSLSFFYSLPVINNDRQPTFTTSVPNFVYRYKKESGDVKFKEFSKIAFFWIKKAKLCVLITFCFLKGV